MIWTAYAITAVVLAVMSASPRREALLSVAAGLVAVWLAKIGLSEAAFWVFLAGIWVAVGAIMMIGEAGGRWSGLRVGAILLVVAGVLAIPARVMGAPHEVGNPLLVLSDVAGVCAILAFGWPTIRGVVGRGVRAWSDYRRRRAGFGVSMAREATKAE